MIPKQEIISIATNHNLFPTTVEKDYVLSWVLNGIAGHAKLSKWLFKGGTCLKKCYFETYRFSEDLDFTVPHGALYNQEDIKTALSEVADSVYQQTGLNLKTREIEVNESISKMHSKTYTAKFTYLGPLNLPARSQQRIKFDITNDELIFDTPDIREVFHPYSDVPVSPTKIKCYSVNEILAEKTRAIFERQGRARDIYDVVNISRNFRDHVDIEKARLGLKEKFKFKLHADPTVDLIFSKVDFAQLAATWKDQLSRQIQLLPPVESFYDDLCPALSWWIDTDSNQFELEPITTNNESSRSVQRSYFPDISLQMKNLGRGNAPYVQVVYSQLLEKIRYAARNRLCIEIDYHKATRLVEPYSLRQPKTGNVLLYAYELTRAHRSTNSIKAYNISKITLAKITSQPFSPRYIIDL